MNLIFILIKILTFIAFTIVFAVTTLLFSPFILIELATNNQQPSTANEAL